MKKKHIITAVIIIIILLVIVILSNLFSNAKNNNKNIDERKYNELNIISEYKEYIVAIDKNYSELDTFAVFKNTSCE